MVKYIEKMSRVVAIAALIWAIWEEPAFANGVCSTLGCFGITVSGIVLPVEAFTIYSIVKCGPTKVAEMVIWINLASFACGFAFVTLYRIYPWMVLAIGLIALIALFVKKKNYIIPLVILFVFNLLVLFACITMPSLQTIANTDATSFPKPHYGLRETITIIITWILYFLLTVVIESLYARRFIRHRSLDWAILAANILSYGIIASIFIILDNYLS
jgi:uncharacterized membrane protein YhaH (DUF805 family)